MFLFSFVISPVLFFFSYVDKLSFLLSLFSFLMLITYLFSYLVSHVFLSIRAVLCSFALYICSLHSTGLSLL